jgi:hypothetical protein
VKAVATALGSPDFTVVEGPPGTGKTTFISELVCQYHDDQPSHRMLVSGQTHVAVDNAISRIALLDPSLTIVRVGRTERVGDEALGMTVDSQMTRWRGRVVAASREYLARLAADEGIDASVADTFGLVEQLGAQEQERGRIGAEIERLAADELSLEERLTDPEAASREASDSSVVTDLQDEFARVREALEDYEGQLKVVGAATERSRIEIARRLGLAKGSTVEEVRAELAARTGGTSEGLERYRALQALQADWLQRFGKDEGFEKALLSTADVVAGTCLGIASVRSLEDLAFDVVIIDESSKATPTETLVPMSRGKRWILVGDPQQLPPFVDGALNEQGLLDDAGLTREQLRTTLFDRLLDLLPSENHLALSVQHRMVRPIGDLVSACFYEGRLLSERVATIFRSLSEVLPAPVTWYSTSHLGSPRRERKSGHSFVNVEEAIRIRNWLGYLHLFAAQREETLTVAVLSGYAAQVGQLQREILPAQEAWPHLKIDVASVDAFQGQERDVAVYSTTRSNPDGTLGFLGSVARLNVSLSRGRDALVIFGDADHCGGAHEVGNPFADVLSHIRSREGEGCALESLSIG